MQRLRLQLIVILVAAVLLPLIPAVMASRDLFRRSLDPLLESNVLVGAQAGLAVSRGVLESEKRRFVERITLDAALDTLTLDEMGTLGAPERSALDELRASGAVSPEAQADDPQGAGGTRVVIPPERMRLGDTDMLVAVAQGEGGTPVFVTAPIADELVARVDRMTRSIQLLQTLRRERNNVLRGFEATFLVVYGVIVAIVLAAGLVLASRLTRPMAALGRGIDRVAAGDLDATVSDRAGGEIGRLLHHFNEMVGRLRTQQAELMRLERLAAWRQMARRLAHEVKNPLTPIQLAAQETRDAYRGDDPEFRRLLDESVAIIEEEVSGLRDLVSEFSQFSRMPAPECDWSAPEELVREIGAMYGEEQIRVAVDTSLDRVWCDQGQMHRALLNLVINAFHAQESSGESTPVEIHVRPGVAGGARIEVLDRGPGVPAEDRRRIFEPDVTTKADGMGLGLAIVENTIRSHEGSIEVLEREGGGAVFVIDLPPGPAGEGDHA